MKPINFDEIAKLFAQRRLSRRQALGRGVTSVAAFAVLPTAALASESTGDSVAGGRAAVPAPATADRFAVLAKSAPGATAIATPTATGAKEITFLFVQSFETGSLVPKAGSPGRYTLTLKQGLGDTIYFSDRPAKIVGTVPTDQFLKGLGFPPDNPPNAALVGHRDANHKDVVVIELFDPKYDASANILTYEVSLLQDWRKLGETFEETPDDAAHLPRDFTAAHLFIDDCPDTQYLCLKDGKTGDFPREVRNGTCWQWVPPTCIPCRDFSPDCNAAYPDFCQGQCGAYWCPVHPTTGEATYCTHTSAF